MGKGAGCFQSKGTVSQEPDTKGKPSAAPEANKAAPSPAVASQPAKRTTMAPTVYIVYYSMYGHIFKLAKEVEAGLKETGVTVKLFQVAETLPEEVLGKMHAPPKQDVPTIKADDLTSADAFIFGFPTRFGNMAGQFKTFWDSTGQLWMKGALLGKPFGIFTSTASQGGGQEVTIAASLPNFINHGMIFVPPGYGLGPQLYDNGTVRGGSPWGAGTFANGDGSRQPTELELSFAKYQGTSFGKFVKRLGTE